MSDPPLRPAEVLVRGARSPIPEGGPRDAGEAVVFVHGNPDSSRDRERLDAKTASFARVVALDMPGFGKADRPADFPCTVEGYAEHLAGALESLGVGRAHPVLHDFGGPRGLPPEFVDRTYDDFDAGTRRAVLRLYRATRDLDRRARRLARAPAPLHRPALVLWGTHDPYVPPLCAEALPLLRPQVGGVPSEEPAPPLPG